MRIDQLLGPRARTLTILVTGSVLLVTDLAWTVGWLSIMNPLANPPPFCLCGRNTAALLVPPPPNPLALLLSYLIAVPLLVTIGFRLANRAHHPSLPSRFAGWLLVGTMAGIGSYTLSLLEFHLPLSEGMAGTRWLIVSIVGFLAAPALVLVCGGVLFAERLRGRTTRRLPTSVG